MPRVLRLLPLFALSVAAAHLVGLGSVAAAGPTSPAPALRQCNEADGPVARLRGGCANGFSAILEDAKTWNPILLAFIGTSFGWFMTALGSAAVIVHGLGLSEASYRKMLDFMLGISGGVMTAASYWSLLAPALEFAAEQGWNDASYVPPVERNAALLSTEVDAGMRVRPSADHLPKHQLMTTNFNKELAAGQKKARKRATRTAYAAAGAATYGTSSQASSTSTSSAAAKASRHMSGSISEGALLKLPAIK